MVGHNYCIGSMNEDAFWRCEMPTALELTREEWQSYIDAAKQHLLPPQLTLIEQEEREQLLTRVREAAATLKDRFEVQQVVLFGSLTDTNWFAPNSDVDLAVKGLSNEAYWQAWKVVEDAIGDRLVDLIEIETAKPSLLEAIQRDGLEL
jgi:predicted nucleotidyltransferase